jgi:DNA-binding CsgD family transcriptional regulator
MLLTFTDIEAWLEIELSHSRYRKDVEAAFAASSACMLLVDAADSVVTLANEQLSSLTGYQPGELVGRSITDDDIWPSGIASGVIRAADGQLLECEVSQSSVTVADETYILWTFQNVTCRRMDERSLAAAIQATVSDAKWLSHAILDNLALRSEPSDHTREGPLADLTAREREVLTLICEGMDDKTMARRLEVSGNTVRNHVASIYSKIGVNRRVAAAAWGRARGFD